MLNSTTNATTATANPPTSSATDLRRCGEWWGEAPEGALMHTSFSRARQKATGLQPMSLLDPVPPVTPIGMGKRR